MSSSVWAANAPVLFFSDLTSGPATGNSDSTYNTNGGVYVTLYGNFLTSPTVTLNGASCLTVVSQTSTWMWYQRMVVQLKSTCASGNFVVTTSGGTSNGLPFTVRSGSIYYVSTSGSDSGSGTYASPWLTIPHAVQTVGTTTGNIVYVKNAYNDSSDDGQGWNAVMTLREGWCQGTVSRPNAVIAYPGANVIIGSSSAGSGEQAIRGVDSSASGGACQGGWTFAELVLKTGAASAVTMDGNLSYPTGGSAGWVMVGNDVTCPYANNQTGCIYASNMDNAGLGAGVLANRLLGNNIHDVGNLAAQPNTDQQHGIYIGDQSRHWEAGWNTISDVVACRGLQVYSNTGLEFDYKIHDNTIHDTTCNGITMWTSDPSQGSGIFVYNNVLWNVGKGPLPGDLGGNFACIQNDHGASSGSPGTGTEYVYNNSCYDAGSIRNATQYSCDGFSSVLVSDTGSSVSNFSNNILFQTGTNPQCPGGLPYWNNDSGNTSPVAMVGSNNIMWATSPSQTPPSNTSSTRFTGTINSDPGLVAATVSGCPSSCSTDLHLSSSSSPASGAGSTTSPTPTYDHDGLLRPSPPSIGAYEYAAGVVAVKPNPPTNLTVVVVMN